LLRAGGGRTTEDGRTGYDRFTNAYFNQDGDAANQTNCKRPTFNSQNDDSVYYVAQPDFFRAKTLAPSDSAAFSFDTAVGIGLAACQLFEEKGTEYFNGKELFNAFVNTEFDGATGRIQIDPKTTSRSAQSAFFVVYNSIGVLDKTGESISIELELTSHTTAVADSESSDVTWVDLPGKAYRYADGSTEPPLTIPPKIGENLNQISLGLQVAVYMMMALIFIFSIGFIVWTYWNRKTRIVRASQPFFLYMICIGTFIMGSAIIPISVDDRIASIEDCSLACIFSPWLASYGFVIAFSALFSKTWRINQVGISLS